MMRALVSASILLTAFTCYSQTVTVQPSTIPGIEIVGPQDSGFAAAVADTVGSDMPPILKPWLPYGVVVKNNSLQPLAGICVVWTRDLNAGPLGYLGGPCATWLERKPFQLQPGRTILAFPDWILQEPGALKPFRDPKLLSNWKDGLANYQRAHTLAVSLDSVVFASGQFAGPDATYQYQRSQARINAPRSVATALLEKKATGTISDILGWLQTLASQPLCVYDHSDFNRCLSGEAARAMLKVYKDTGEAALYLKAENILQAPAFPLHQ